MNIKGHIGDKVIVFGEVTSITASENNKIRYGVKLDFDNSTAYILEASDFKFIQLEDIFETPGDIPKRNKKGVK